MIPNLNVSGALENKQGKTFWYVYHFCMSSPLMSRLVSQAILKSGRPLILGSGVSPADLKVLEENTRKELAEAEVASYSAMVVVTARKKALAPS
jgi:hypothetical protein